MPLGIELRPPVDNPVKNPLRNFPKKCQNNLIYVGGQMYNGTINNKTKGMKWLTN
jgi:hypothetical protein